MPELFLPDEGGYQHGVRLTTENLPHCMRVAKLGSNRSTGGSETLWSNFSFAKYSKDRCSIVDDSEATGRFAFGW